MGEGCGWIEWGIVLGEDLLGLLGNYRSLEKINSENLVVKE